MHNGSIEGFPQIKRRLQSLLSDEVFNVVKGNTDSEWSFALFLSKVSLLVQFSVTYLSCLSSSPTQVLRRLHTKPSARPCLRQSRPSIDLATKLALLRCATDICVVDRQYSPVFVFKQPSLMNFCVTDGESVVATRYVSSRHDEAASLVRALLDPKWCSLNFVRLCSGSPPELRSVNMLKVDIIRCPNLTSGRT